MIGKVFLAKRLFINNNNVNLLDPIVELRVPFLPTTQTFSVFGKILDDNPKSRYDVQLQIVDSNEDEVFSLSGNLDNAILNQRSEMQIDINLDNIIFRTSGEHLCILKIDGNIVDECNFYLFNEEAN